MNFEDLNGKTLYFEMLVHQEGETKTFARQGFTKMTATKGAVSIMWADYPGATSGKSITFKNEDVHQFVENAERRSFTLGGQTIVPDYIYLDEKVQGAFRHG